MSSGRTPQTRSGCIQSVEAEIGGRKVTVEIVGHAQDRMEQRGVSLDDVLVCIRQPDERNLRANGPNRKRVRRYDATSTSHGVEVVYQELAADRIRIITAIRYRRMGR